MLESNKRVDAIVAILGTDGWQMVEDEIIMLDGSAPPTEEALQIEIANIEAVEALSVMTKLLENYIHAEVEKYNTENGLQFGSIHSVANYINTPTYTHHNWCVQVWDWNVKVWETGRDIQRQVSMGERGMPTQEEVLLELPVFVLEPVVVEEPAPDTPVVEEPISEPTTETI